jgi:ADP-ribose pyrophosphatase YjhB (NUDIX family)
MASDALSETTFAELVVGILLRNNGELVVPVCCQELYALNSEYKAFIKKHGGLKKLCSRNPETLQFVDDGGCGVLRISGPPEAKVKDSSQHPPVERKTDPGRDAGSDWITSHMPEWLLKAMESWPSGWGADQDAAYQQDLQIWTTMKQTLKKMPVSRENYESAMLNEAERDGFHAASVVMISQDRALMLFEREENGRILLGLPGGQRSCIAEDAWSCARREALEETGGQAKLSTTPPASVAWQATTKQAVFVYATSDELVAEDIQGLCRPPEGEQGLLPPSGPLTAVWVPLTLLRTTNFQKRYLHPHKSGPLMKAAFRLMDFRGGDRRLESTEVAVSASTLVAAATTPEVEWVLVDSIAKSKAALKVISESVKESKVVAIDIEGDLTPSGRLSLIQVGLESEEVFIFDVHMCPDLLGPKAGPDGLRALLSSNIKKFAKVTKVLHDCRADAAALKGQFGIVLPHEPVCTVWDTQTYHSIAEGKNPDKHLLGLNVILQKYAGQINKRKDQVKHRPGVWEQRPLPQLLLVQFRKSLLCPSSSFIYSQQYANGPAPALPSVFRAQN